MSQENRFVTVETYINPWDAQISRALLESEGIPATLGSEHHISIYWPMALVLGGVRVVVPVCMLTPALAVLEERDQGVLQTALELLEDEFEVWVVTDACSSRTERNRDAAFDRLAGAGAELVTTEMVAFEWLRSCEHEDFRDMLQLIK